jgi:hypothetical protein
MPLPKPHTQAPYLSLTPLSIAPHRYISFLYAQPEVAEYMPPKLGVLAGTTRTGFDVTKYVEEGGLVLVGGNFLLEVLGTLV